MSVAALSSLIARGKGVISRTLTVAPSAEQVCQTTPVTEVGEVRLSHSADRYAAQPYSITDAQREAAIKLAAAAVERHMKRYEETHCFGAFGDADRARMSMEALIKLRSPEQVSKMERERGLV